MRAPIPLGSFFLPRYGLGLAIAHSGSPDPLRIPPGWCAQDDASKPRKSNILLQNSCNNKIRARMPKSQRIFVPLYMNFRFLNEFLSLRQTIDVFKFNSELRRFLRFWIYCCTPAWPEGRTCSHQKSFRIFGKYWAQTFQNFWPIWNRLIFRRKRCFRVASQKPWFCSKWDEITYFGDL